MSALEGDVYLLSHVQGLNPENVTVAIVCSNIQYEDLHLQYQSTAVISSHLDS